MKEKRINSNKVFDGQVLQVFKDEVLCPNGNISYREIIKHGDGVCILAEIDDKYILEEQYRYAYDDFVLELPAGKVEDAEDLELAALRELEEETGYKAKKIEKLGVMYPSCGYTNEVIHLYYASDLMKTKQHLDQNEFLTLSFYTIEELEEMIREGKIVDAKTINLLYLYKLKKK